MTNTTQVRLVGQPIVEAGVGSEANGYGHMEDPNSYLLVHRVEVGEDAVDLRAPNPNATMELGVTVELDSAMAKRIVNFLRVCFEGESPAERNNAGFVLNVLGLTKETYVEYTGEPLSVVSSPEPLGDRDIEPGKVYGFGNGRVTHHMGIGLGDSMLLGIKGYGDKNHGGLPVIESTEFERMGGINGFYELTAEPVQHEPSA